MRILITGITGFVGGHLVEHLVASGGHALFGVSRRGEWPAQLAHLAPHARLVVGDLCGPADTERVLLETRPDWIVHLAGYANTGGSFRDPDRAWAENLTATRVLYDAVVRSGLRPRTLFVSTGLIYGEPDVPDGACDERTTLKPASPYAASKAAADIVSYQYSRSAGLDIVRVRLFNQIGPRQSADFAVPNFARQIAAAEAGKHAPVVETGDLSAKRDIADVRDIVASFPLLLEKGASGEAYNAARGESFRIQDLLDRLVSLSRIPIRVNQTIEPGRKADTSVTRADVHKLRAATGWYPRVPLDRTLADILDYWRSVAAG
ncbi:GDP-mannose 4,6-dehydratase [Frigoriglobus tundricola]|uniref:UDP-glucose 4-epimerase n=1 Tax=Frigoriglobus tundricola TaxID=2774151 RepID=A0A6M5YGP5_9BACT|nr:GDP-mannose 4,6-dehydratase [Frigoriglobus tundricola]QJW93168.1 UDP-glucose 4-epimerase [Frigoriglobus tundricola]